ncbi:MAG: hypothetical protein LBG30_03250 [Odoribacteraceae bacterium]|jgi:hypothetical protein|nr:hypothetical protein [Odoribacteraceae bacterium]
MKKYIIIMLLVLPWTVACDRSDPSGPVSVFANEELDTEGAVARRIKEMQDKYSLVFRYEFKDSDLSYNWTENLSGMPYTKADPEYVIPMLDFIEDKVFSLFPEGFIKKYLQANILLVDSLKHSYYDDDMVAGTDLTRWKSIVGHVTRNALILSHVSKDFDPTSTSLKEDFISLFIERMMVNSNLWPRPDAFAAIAEADGGTAFSTVYWAGDLGDLAYWWSSTPEGFVYPDGYTGPTSTVHQWYRSGILKMGRLGLRGITNYGDPYGYIFLIYCGTIGQDFGDYVNFIISKTAAQKEAFFDYLRSLPAATFGDRPVEEVITRMRTKIQLVKDYFKEHFNIELKDLS